MTVAQYITELQKMPQDAIVVVESSQVQQVLGDWRFAKAPEKHDAANGDEYGYMYSELEDFSKDDIKKVVFIN